MASTGQKKNDFTLYPLLWLAVCFAAGVLAAGILSGGRYYWLAACLIPAAFSVIFIKRPAAALVFLSVAFMAAGGLHVRIGTESVSAERLKILYETAQIGSGDPIELEGILSNEPEPAVGGMFLLLRAEKAFYKGRSLKVAGNVRFFAPVRDDQAAAEYERLNLGYGSRIRVAANVRRQDDYLDPGVASRKLLLDRQNTDAAGTIKSPLLIETAGGRQGFAPLARLYRLRRVLIEEFREHFDHQTAGVLIASLLGNRYFLDKRTAGVFREGGTFHVLVISGLHITFIGGLTLLLVRFFTRKRLRQFLLAAAFLWTYSLAVGAQVPVVRASLMFTVLLFSQVIYRRGTLLNAFGASLLILLVWRPEDVYDPSFQLTAASVAAIVAMAFPLIEKLRAIGGWSPSATTPFPPNVSVRLKRFGEMLYWRENVWKMEAARQIWSARLFKSPYLRRFAVGGGQGIIRYLFEGILVSLVVQIWLLPFLVVYFHRLALFGVLLNLWVGINLALESLAAVAALLLAQINSGLAAPLIRLTELLNYLLLAVPQFLTENDWASVRLPVYSGNMRAVYFFYFGPVLLLTFLLNYWKPFSLHLKSSAPLFRRAGLSMSILLGGLIVFHPFSAPSADGRLHLDFLDVGQGDAALITFPNGETMLVDGGGRMNFSRIDLPAEDDAEPEPFEPDAPSVGERVVSEFLWEKGYARIDYILATHADADHIQGLTDVAGNFRVGKALFGRTPLQNDEFSRLFAVLEKRGVAAEVVSRGDVLNFGDVRVEVLYPERDPSDRAVSDNNHSVVLRIVCGKRKFLLTGDIEKETEQILVQNSALEADLVKVAHHGSRTSSTPEFIEAVNTAYAIIPVGRESPFGHPHPEVLERWLNSGAKILTTGERGTISVSTDGKDLIIGTFVQ